MRRAVPRLSHQGQMCEPTKRKLCAWPYHPLGTWRSPSATEGPRVIAIARGPSYLGSLPESKDEVCGQYAPNSAVRMKGMRAFTSPACDDDR
jgi:hypothetical protein